ncbi:hypothetical protein B0H12DRAFT_1116916 [Mycena haematopus]|nr:hypothetical protein B0H12DRAFT_1116916 [Mycena haematopus]
MTRRRGSRHRQRRRSGVRPALLQYPRFPARRLCSLCDATLLAIFEAVPRSHIDMIQLTSRDKSLGAVSGTVMSRS